MIEIKHKRKDEHEDEQEHAKGTTPKSPPPTAPRASAPSAGAAPATAASAGRRSVNWHRIIWQLRPSPDAADDHGNYFRTNLLLATNSNTNINNFWLEPELYPGPTQTFGQGPALVQFDANSLCFRVRFLDGEMAAPWQNCLLFPRGSEALQFDNNNKPQPATETARLVGRTTLGNGQPAKLTVYMDSNNRQLKIFASEIGIGNHLGMGVAHQ
jgi:hypothetical protein